MEWFRRQFHRKSYETWKNNRSNNNNSISEEEEEEEEEEEGEEKEYEKMISWL